MRAKMRKIDKKLAGRLKGYRDMCEAAERRQAGSSKAYTAPGSRNGRKS